ncbi:hypothetical protein HII31_05380 [Pseudocercospora fuligena]|uniref:Uncharacterized protein n=1 Tax=Pseudocercospora fuligena TaxID=685502 RepID=A0A8H6RLN8_9PEZI|nr:hypothetical protein HII31_05380 [Pseudocercospora fuligena]
MSSLNQASEPSGVLRSEGESSFSHSRFSFEQEQAQSLFADGNIVDQVSRLSAESSTNGGMSSRNTQESPALHNTAFSEEGSNTTDQHVIKQASSHNTKLQTTDEDDGHEVPSAPRPRRGPAATLSLWWWEIGALALGLASFVSIIVVLLVYDNKTLATWGVPISINAVVSILTALFKESLALPIAEGISQLKWLHFSKSARSLVDMETFDRASRGPWGSILLIGRQFAHKQRSYLSMLGALIILITLAVDPFSQASVGYYSCRRSAPSLASISRTNSWYDRAQVHIDPLTAMIGAPMQLALYLGFFQPPANSSVSIDVSCVTGNCTFPSDHGASFSTLSMCYTCEDLTRYAVKNSSEMGTLQYTLPSGLAATGYNVFNTSAVSVLNLPDGVWRDTTFLGWHGITLKSDKECDWFDATCGSSVPFAFTCSFQPCVKTYTANVTKTIYNETELLEHRRSLHYNPMQGNYELALNRTLVNGTWKDCTTSDRNTSTHSYQYFGPAIQDVVYQGSTEGIPSSWYEPECVYNMYGPSVALNSTQQFWSSTFFGDDGNLITGSGGVLGPAWLLDLWNRGHINMTGINSHAAGIAESLGAYLRKNSADEDSLQTAQGQAWDTHICIGVQWGYLTYLAAVLVLELVFFALVVVAYHGNAWSSDWKSSVLAVVFRGGIGEPGCKAEGDIVQSYDRRQDEMWNAAREVKVKLTGGDRGWRLAEAT